MDSIDLSMAFRLTRDRTEEDTLRKVDSDSDTVEGCDTAVEGTGDDRWEWGCR